MNLHLDSTDKVFAAVKANAESLGMIVEDMSWTDDNEINVYGTMNGSAAKMFSTVRQTNGYTVSSLTSF